MTTMRRIALLTVLMHLSFAGARVTISLLAIHLGASAFTIGAIVAAFAVVPMVFSISWGRYVDRVGVRTPLHVGTCVLLAGLILTLAVPRIEMLFLTGALAGSGFYLCHITVSQAAGLIGDADKRVRNFGMLALAFSTSSFLGPIVAGFAIDHLGYRATFIVLSVPLLAMIALMLAQPVAVPRHASALKAVGERRIIDLLRLPAMRRVFVVSGMLSMSWDLYSFVLPIHGANLKLSASTIGTMLGVFGAAVFVTRLALPLVHRHLTEWTLLIGAMVLSGSVLAVMPLVTDVALLVALSFMLGIGLGGAQPMVLSLIYENAPAGRAAEAVGVRTVLINFSQTGIPLMFGAVGAALGMTPVFLTMALALLGGAYYARRR